MRISASTVAAIAGLLIVWACAGGSSDTRVPRPRAYARIPLYDANYRAVDSLPIAFEANSSAVVRPIPTDAPDAVWLDVRYPAYAGVLHLTFTRAADSARREAVVANRTERMALDFGDVAAEQSVVTSPSGYATSLLRATSLSPTPLQFIAVGRRGCDWVVSGTFEFDALPSAVDSVLPVVDAVEADIVHAATHLRP